MSSISNKVEKVLKQVLGPITFFEMKHFFLKLHTMESDFLIFTTRRAHLLYCLFNRYFFSEIKAGSKNIIDDKALHFYDKQLCKAKCVLVDDILIHGRALKDIFDRLENKKPSEIKIFVFATEKSPEYKFKNIQSVRNNVTREEWEKLSNRIVAALHITSTPYASYIFSFSKSITLKKYNKLKRELIKVSSFPKNIDLSLNEIDNESMEINSAISKSVESIIFDLKGFSEENNLVFSCVRVYYNKYLGICTVIPFAITYEMDKDQIEKLCLSIFPRESEILNTKCIEAKYRAISSFYSVKIVTSYLKKLNISQWNINSQDVCMSYYKSFYNDLESGLKKQITPLVLSKNSNTIVEQYVIPSVKNDIYFEQFNKIKLGAEYKSAFFDTKNHTPLECFFYKFLVTVNFYEDKLFHPDSSIEGAGRKVEKQRGISLTIFGEALNFIKETSLFDFFTKLIQCSDTGFITIFADGFFLNGEKKYFCFFITGEQVCRLYQNKYIIFLYQLNKYYKEYKRIYNINVDFDDIIKCCANYSSEHSKHIQDALSFIKDWNNDSFFQNVIYMNTNDFSLDELLIIGIKKMQEEVINHEEEN